MDFIDYSLFLMVIMIKVFAKRFSKERIAVFSNAGLVEVNEKYEGDWIFVDDFRPGDVIRFECDEAYRGFDAREGVYSPGALEKKVF